MADVYFVGNAAAIAQVTTLTVVDASPASTETWTITIGDKALVYTVPAVDTPADATELAAAILANLNTAVATGGYAEFAELEWSVSAGVITATGPVGVPILLSDETTCAISTSETAGSGTFVTAITTAASGPNFANVAANWSDGAVPDGSDTPVFSDTDIDCLYGLATAFPIASVTLTGFRVDASYTGKIGLPLFNENGYEEYRSRYLKVGLDPTLTIPIGWGPGNGSSRLYLDFETAATTTVKVYNTGQSEEGDGEALRLLMVHAADVLEIAGGSVGLAREVGQVSTVPTVRIQSGDGQDGNTIFRAGSGCTLTTIVCSGGEVLTDCALTTMTLLSGTWTHTGGAVTTIVNTAGTMVDQSTGTISAYTGRGGSVYDHRSDFRAKTYTAVDLYAGATWLDPNAAANTYTAGIDFNQCYQADVIWDVGPNRRLTPGSVA
jgi:hypothetical protein